jgi:hypothetical protein
MSNSNETSNADLKNSKTGWSLTILIGIGLVIVGFYFFNFNAHILKNEGWWKVLQNLSTDTGNWGTFGDYVGGILNPVIAAFAFYLIRETYKLQKTELEETRKLLENSTKAQKAQVKLASLTAQHNLNLARISVLESEKMSLFEREAKYERPDNLNEIIRELESGGYGKPKAYSQEKMDTINSEIKRLKSKNIEIEEKIETFDLYG